MQVRVLISGLVQGIGFRYFVLDRASELGVTGWVRNTSDNKVEALFQGEEDKVKELIDLCRKGPALAKVEKIEEFPSSEPIYQDFLIRK